MNEKKHNEKHIPGYFLIERKQQQQKNKQKRFMLYDIIEILLKVALSTINSNLKTKIWNTCTWTDKCGLTNLSLIF